MDWVKLADALTVAEFDGWVLRVLAVRHPGAAHADRLSPSVARRLISDALSQADFVVIDSPPLTDVSDALPLANLADEVLVVARMGVSKMSRLARLHDMLVSQGTTHGSGAGGERPRLLLLLDRRQARRER